MTVTQQKAVDALVADIKRGYGLSEADVYAHAQIAHKTAGEGDVPGHTAPAGSKSEPSKGDHGDASKQTP